jgi:hypothetical protein
MIWWGTARATAGRPMSFVHLERLERLGVGDRHVHEVVGLPEQAPHRDHFAEGDDGGLGLLDGAPVVGRDVDDHDDLEGAPLPGRTATPQ